MKVKPLKSAWVFGLGKGEVDSSILSGGTIEKPGNTALLAISPYLGHRLIAAKYA